MPLRGRAGSHALPVYDPAHSPTPSRASEMTEQNGTGGGAPLREESRKAMRDNGQVIWLKALPETIHVRMTGDQTTAARRPNLTSQGGLEEIVQLLSRREPIYRESAHLEVDTEEKSPEAVTAEILERLTLVPNAKDRA